MTGRFLVLLLCVLASLGLFTVAASADGGITTWSELQAALNGGGTCRLTQDITAAAGDIALEVPSGVTATLDLNGHTVDRNLADASAEDDGYVIFNAGTLTIKDSSAGQTGTITGGNNTGDGGGILNSGTLKLTGGVISGNTAGGSGGGINNGGTLTVNGGAITDNTATGWHGGGIYNSGTLNLHGGSITGNVAQGSQGSGQGGGLLNNGTLNVSGAPIVSGNTGPNGNNIFMRNAHRTMTVIGALTDGASLYVTSARGKDTITSGYREHNTVHPRQFFHAENTAYCISLEGSEAKISEDGLVTAPYIKRGWNGSAVTAETAFVDAHPVPADGSMTSGWYYLNRNIALDSRIESITGNVNLILGDGFTLAVKGIYVPAGTTLTIYGQSAETGKIYSVPSGGAGIGGYDGHDNGNIVIHGGVIEAQGHKACAGIGGNSNQKTGNITIYGGGVSATGGQWGAGIGAGRNSDGGTVTIYGGTVTATAGSDSAAGIGGGDTSGSYADNTTIHIYGGDITATGHSKGAGIGGGEYGHATITISGGTVTATGGSSGGAGIGSGVDGAGSSITITGGVINASSASSGGYSIGSGKNKKGACTVKLGYTTATFDTIQITAPSGFCSSDTVNLTHWFQHDDRSYRLSPGIQNAEALQMMAAKTLIADPEFAIRVTDSEHGQIVPSVRTAMAGASVRLTPKGDSGYSAVPAGITVTREDNGETIPVNDNYTFTMPAAHVTVTATFVNQGTVRYLGLDGRMHEAENVRFVSDGLWEWEGGKWYAVTSDTSIDHYVALKRPNSYEKAYVNLILCDGATLSLKEGITVNGDHLTIWAQSDAQVSGNTGRLLANTGSDWWIGYPGIGGYGGMSGYGFTNVGGSITINGGYIVARGENYSAGIGGGKNWTSGAITINGGVVYATSDGVAIGGGVRKDSVPGSVTINGGTVYANKDGGKGIGNCKDVRIALTDLNDSVSAGVYWDCDLTLVGNYVDQYGRLYPAGRHDIDDPDLVKTTLRLIDKHIISFAPGDENATGEMNATAIPNGVQYTLPKCGFTAPERGLFEGWSVVIGSNEPVTAQPGEKVTVTDNTILTAIWSYTKTVTFRYDEFNADPPVGQGMASVDLPEGSDYILPECGFTVPADKRFREWSVAVGESEAVTKAAGDTIAVTDDTVVTAMWDDTRTVAFAPGDGAGSMDSETVVLDSVFTLPRCGFIAPEGKRFKEWSVVIGGADAVVKAAGDTIIITDSTTVTAVWEDLPEASAEDVDATYDGLPHGITVTVNSSVNGAVIRFMDENGQYTLTESPTVTNVADSPLTVFYQVTAEGGFTASGSADIRVEKAPLTITARSKIITYGDEPANDGAEYDGFVNGETANVLAGTLVYDYSYAQYGDVGTAFTITPGDVTAANYSITFVPGTLTVVPKEVALAWSEEELVYNGEAQAPAVSAAGFVNNDEVSVTVTGARTDAGSDYTAFAALTGAKAGNYALPADPTTQFVIRKKPMEDVELSGFLRCGQCYSLDLSDMIVEGGTMGVPEIQDPDGILAEYSVENGILSFGLKNDNSLAGKTASMSLTVTSANYADYQIIGSVTVTAKTVIMPEVTLASRTYGEAGQAPVVTGNVGRGAVTISYKQKDAGDDAYSSEAPTAAGEYTVRAEIAETDEYAGGTATADFTILPAQLIIVVNDQSYPGDGQPHGENAAAYDDPDVIAGKVTVSGLRGSDRLSAIVLDGYEEAPGEYPICLDSYTVADSSGAGANKNYTIIVLPGKLTIAIPTYEVTYRVINGTWADGTTANKTETVQSGSKPVDVPTGMKASEGYTGGAWNANPAEATITGATTFTYTFEAKQAATVTKAPTAKSLIYTGSAQELVNAGEATGGTMRYALGTDATTAPTTGWTASIPTATLPGTYFVWYMAVGDENHNDSAAACVTVEISTPTFGPATFTLPGEIKSIGESAFEGLPMTIVEIPSGCQSIGKWAFRNCTGLTQIRIPASVTSIDTTAFEGCTNVLIYGTAPSAAKTFCDTHDNCAFVAEDTNG